MCFHALSCAFICPSRTSISITFFFLIEASYIGSVSLFASDAFLNRVSLFNLTENMTPEQRRENYSCDITYVTNSELGFDYLRDNLAMVCVFLCWKFFVFISVDHMCMFAS